MYFNDCLQQKKNTIKKNRSTSVTHWEALVHMLG